MNTEKEPVEIVDYNPRYHVLFERYKKMIKAVLNGLPRDEYRKKKAAFVQNMFAKAK